jgi:hypothetical protein
LKDIVIISGICAILERGMPAGYVPYSAAVRTQREALSERNVDTRAYAHSSRMLIFVKGKTLRANLSSFEWILNFLRRAKRSQNPSKFRDCSQGRTSLIRICIQREKIWETLLTRRVPGYYRFESILVLMCRLLLRSMGRIDERR